MRLSIRTRLTFWYAGLVASILVLLGLGVLAAASLGLRKAADQELTLGVDGVEAFLRHKLARREMNNLNDELREHSALLPRSKMFRVSNLDGSLVYQPDAMAPIAPIVPAQNELRKQSVIVGGRPYRTVGRFATAGPYRFLIQVAVDQSQYGAMINGLAEILILGIPVAGMLAGIAGYWMSGRALSPIHRITESTNSIDIRSLSRRLPILGTNDELDRLSTTINSMLNRIAKSYERIAQFTSDASHELRTPIALVRSNAELLLMEPELTPRVHRGLCDILAESIYMTRLIGDLLTLARNGDTDASLPMDLLELNDSVRNILERAKALADARALTLEFKPCSQIVPLRGNQNMIERILLILIDNAVRYTHPGGSIRIQTWATADRCGFVVRDTGIGISTENHERIFDRFFRVDTARTPRDGGCGLGLSIARDLVEFLNGTIRVDSAIGAGTGFTIGFARADVEQATTELHASHPSMEMAEDFDRVRVP